MVGIAIISFTLPAVPFSLLAGAYVDYLDKRLVLWMCNALRAVTMGLIVVALLWNRSALLPLYLLSFIISLISQFFTPAESSSIPLLVSRQDIMPALSLFNVTLTLAQAIGFLLLGQLITTLVPPFHIQFPFGSLSIPVQPVETLFICIALIYALCTVLVITIHKEAFIPRLPKKTRERLAWWQEVYRIVRHDVRESWDLIRRDHILFLGILRAAFVGILLLVIGELAGPFVKNVLHLPANDLSLIFAPAGVALVVGGLFMPRLTRRLGRFRTISLGIFAAAVSFVLLPLGQFVTTRIPAISHGIAGAVYVAAMAFLVGLALDCINIPSETQVQERAPEHERGRIFAFQAMLYNAGSIPVILLTGLVADSSGIEIVMYMIAVALFFFQIWSMWFRRTSQL